MPRRRRVDQDGQNQKLRQDVVEVDGVELNGIAFDHDARELLYLDSVGSRQRLEDLAEKT